MSREDVASLQGVTNAAAVLELLARHGAGLGGAAIGRKLDLPPSTAHRLLRTLEGCGLVEQDRDSKLYRLGLKLFELASAVSRRLGLRETARPLLERLARETEETVHLVKLDRGECVVIEDVESPRTVYVRSLIGERRPLHATSAGKVLLAFLPAEQMEEVLARGLRRFTSTTETDPSRLRAELAEVRAKGYAVNWGGYREEAAGVAAPVWDRSGRVVASVAVAAPIGRLAPLRAEVVAEKVLACAESISKQLGWWPASVEGEAAAEPALARAVGIGRTR